MTRLPMLATEEAQIELSPPLYVIRNKDGKLMKQYATVIPELFTSVRKARQAAGDGTVLRVLAFEVEE